MNSDNQCPNCGERRYLCHYHISKKKGTRPTNTRRFQAECRICGWEAILTYDLGRVVVTKKGKKVEAQTK